MSRVVIIGAGLSGLTAAVTLAQAGRACVLVSMQPSERAQSVLAEGGINAALDTMGENDTPAEHFADTMRGGGYLADESAVADLTENAPETVRWLASLGVPFNMQAGHLIQRNFGGQKKKRTAFAKSSTGKMIMTSLIDEARKYEAAGLIKRYPHHEFIRLLTEGGRCSGALVRDRYTGLCAGIDGVVLLACGGLNGMFPGMTTGTTQNTADAAAAAFSQGVELSNLEMLQYHPTTVGIPGKRCLVTEAARGEGGRLFIMRGEDKYYFMEDRYPELKNLSPRDVVAREMFFVRREFGGEVYLDMTGLDSEVWKTKLPDLRKELISFLALDPKESPIPVREGIHYFMGGIRCDRYHRTSMPGLYAAGECTSLYHGANRLGGNSMLGAVYGGKAAALDILSRFPDSSEGGEIRFEEDTAGELCEPADEGLIVKISGIFLKGLGIVRNEQVLERCIGELDELSRARQYNAREGARLSLARAMLISAKERRESRGAHYREDFPERDDRLRLEGVVTSSGGQITHRFEALPEGKEENADQA